jgi:hypothetical protein
MKFPRIFVTPDGEPRFGEPLALGLATVALLRMLVVSHRS